MFFSRADSCNIVSQVVATKEEIDPPSEQQPPKRSDGLNPDLANHLSKVAFRLALTEEEHSVRFRSKKTTNVLHLLF